MCKKQLELRLACCGEEETIKAHYHPKGCMKARQSHIDITIPANPHAPLRLLYTASKPRGIIAQCTAIGGCIELVLDNTLPPINLCIERPQESRLGCTGKTYIKYTGRALYIGPIQVR